ncbi:MAG: FAD/NAD(P)-binding protein [Actinomycetota bacterium]
MADTGSVDTIVVGAGASGLLAATHLRRQDPTHRVAIVDPRTARDVGIAYSTTDADHLMNVRSSDLSAFPGDGDHFVGWLTDRDGACDPRGFVPRAVYGAYLRHLLDEVAPVERRQAGVVDLDRDAGSLTAVLSDGQSVTAGHAVLALGHARPPAVGWLGDRAASPTLATRLIDDPWTDDGLARIHPEDTVVVIGSGLTAVDVVVTLGRPPRRTPITTVSSRGLWPCRHPVVPTPREPSPVEPGMSPSQITRIVRGMLDRAEAAGDDWRAIIDGLRPVTVDVWRAWSDDDRDRFARLLRRQWDRHRHRMAPSVADRIDELETRGLVRRACGRVVAVGPATPDIDTPPLAVELADGTRLTADWVVNCTGPDPRVVHRGDPLVDDLLARGRARPGWNGWGLVVDPDGRLVDADGRPDPRVSVVGPLRIGGEWESTAIPEIRRQAESIAARVATG